MAKKALSKVEKKPHPNAAKKFMHNSGSKAMSHKKGNT